MSVPSALRSAALPGPENIARMTLPNGLTILVRENHAAPLAVLHGSLRAGAIYERPEQAGLASFVAGMLTRGSAGYDYAAFNEAVESVGASLTVSADVHSTDIGLTALAEDFDDLLALLADILQFPTFAEEHVERLRRMKLVRIQERDQDTGSIASQRFYAALFGRDHAYGRATGGYLESVGALQPADLHDFHRRYYSPQGAVFALSGAVDAAQITDRIAALFGGWSGPELPPHELPPLAQAGGRHEFAAMPGKVQSDLMVGAHGVARHDPDFYAARVANCILGQFGMMGRLGERVREEQGLAYYCYSSLVAEQDAGAWLASAGVNPEDVDDAVASVLAEFDRLGETAVGAEELADSQAYLTGVLPLTLETNEGVADALLNMEWHGLGLDYLQRYHSLIYGVTADDVRRVARQYLAPEKCIVVVAGPDAGDGEPDAL